MSSDRYNLRPRASRVAATRAAQELGISASEARRNTRLASRRQQPPRPRIRLVGAWAPENRAQHLREERLRQERSNHHVIIQTRPLENPDRPQIQLIRHAVPAIVPEAQGQRPHYSLRQFPHQRIHSIHDNKKGVYVYHHKRDAQRNISSTWLGLQCVSLYDIDLRGTIWENHGMFAYIQKLKETTDHPVILHGRFQGSYVYTFDCRTREYTWRAPGL
ncbi:hypothetical protein PG993_004976 [Apiospora rasikravindrae]|uniref:WW domain-containing protein n=1 Tax=Apiospora rasikravindrae TaxID=990691 RepID=A0ABR1TEC7_9PEZI